MDELIALLAAEIDELDRRLRDWWQEVTADIPGRLWAWAVLFGALAMLALLVLWFGYLRP